MRTGIPVRVQGGRGRRVWAARGLWAGAELAVTLGLLVLLLVAHQLWWTNREARAEAGRTVHALEEQWGEDGGRLLDAVPPAGGGAGPKASAAPPEEQVAVGEGAAPEAPSAGTG
ncbi:class E sortase, partial [Streptomyces hundungensis]